MSNHPFRFDLLKIEQPLNLWNTELLSAGPWDNLFYRGEFHQQDLDQIRCITPCRNCYLNWFDIRLNDFQSNHLRTLVSSNLITLDQIKEKGVAEIVSLGNDHFFKTRSGASAEFAVVKCNHCNTKHFLVMGITETQPGLYSGQLHGVWRIKE